MLISFPTCCLSTQNKNTHLNQAIHEEQEAILELRVQLRLLQSHKLQQEMTVQLPAEQAPPTQPSPEPRGEEQTKRPVVAAAVPPGPDPAASANGKAAKDPSKPSPSKDRREVWDATAPVCRPVLSLHTWTFHCAGFMSSLVNVSSTW